MSIADDIRIRADGFIEWIGSSNNSYTVLEFHRYLQEIADNVEGDSIDIVSYNPSTRITDHIIILNNGYYLSEETASHIREGSIQIDGEDLIWTSNVDYELPVKEVILPSVRKIRE